METIRILLLEDDPVDRLAVERAVEQDSLPYEILTAGSLADALELVKDKTFDLALLDYRLQDGTAFEFLSELQSTPTIFVTGSGNETVAAEALRQGAYDYLIKDPDRKYLSLLPATIEKVLLRRRTEDAVRESESRYEDLFNNAPDMYFLLDESGIITAFNQQAALHLGYAGNELQGRPFLDLVYEIDRSLVREQFNTSLHNMEDVQRSEFRARCKNGDIRYVSEHLSVHPASGDYPLSIRVICRDITEMRNAEQRELELQERLARHERMESLVVLAGGVAHDLNNILGPLVVYPDLLSRQFEKDSRPWRDLMEIKRSAQRAADVVRDLLTLGRGGKLDAKPMNLNEVIETYLQAPSFQDQGKFYPGVNVEIDLAGDLKPILGSEHHLLKAIMNLAINSFEAMPEGGTISISTFNEKLSNPRVGYEVLPEGDYSVMQVTDTGIGVDPRELSRLFEPFFTKKKLGRSGSGLGLSVVYGVIKDHDGFIDLTSSLDRGTTFKLFFPSISAIPQAREEEEHMDCRGTERILIVDDVSEQRAIARRILEELGYRCDTANNGHAALDQIAKARENQAHAPDYRPYDLLVLDMIMEENFDGLDTYQEIQKLYPQQKAIIVSGYSATDRVKRAQESGSCPYIHKPYTAETLGRAVRTELDRK